jgi:hypothetical protein
MSESLRTLQLSQTSVIPKQSIVVSGGRRVLLVLLCLTGFLGYFSVGSETILLGVVACLVTFELLNKMNQGFPLVQIIAFVAVIQWLIGPWLTYNLKFAFSTYDMRVPFDVYFAYAIPGTAAFVAGLLGFGLCARQRLLTLRVDRLHFVKIGFILLSIGMVGTLGTIYLAGSSVAFFFNLLAQLRYISVFYFVFSSHRLRFVFAIFASSPLYFAMASSAMFHDFILWICIFLCYYFALKKRSILSSSLVLLLGFIFVFTLQGVKASYREKVWNSEDSSLVEEVKTFWSDPGYLLSDNTIANGIIRLNQGWIVAAVMNHVPSIEPYAMGETFKDGFFAALLPRFILENKVGAVNRDTFRRFTGIPIGENTSMGLSLLGESYANFNPRAGVFVMLIFGLLLSLWNNFCLSYASKKPEFYFWIPLIFCQAIKAETDFVTVFNYIVKSSVVAFTFFWLLRIQIGRTTRSPLSDGYDASLLLYRHSGTGTTQSSLSYNSSES